MVVTCIKIMRTKTESLIYVSQLYAVLTNKHENNDKNNYNCRRSRTSYINRLLGPTVKV